MIKYRFLQSLKLGLCTGGIVIAIAFIFMSFIYFISIGNLNWLLYSNEMKQGEALIEKIESFKFLHKRLPSEEEFIHISKSLDLYKGEDSCPCYGEENKNYSISFPAGVGSSFVYRSETCQWQIHD